MGNLVRLRPVTEADLPAYVRWFNDPEVVGLLITEVKEATATTEWVWLHSKLTDPTERLWSMEVDGRLIGNCALHLRGEQGAELGILIGEKDAWGRGYGTDTVRQLLAVAFSELDLWRVWLRTRGSNGRAIRCYEKAGLRQEGLQRQAILRQGKWVDVMLMAILRSEWEEMQAAARPGLHIRTCRPDDYEAVVRVWQETGLGPRPDRGDSRADIVLKLRRDPELALVACWDGEVVGTVLGGWDGRRGWAYRLGVRPAWQRRGIATALLAKLERRLLAQGCRFVNLMFFDDNEAAKALYGKAGYDFWPGVCVAGKTLTEE